MFVQNGVLVLWTCVLIGKTQSLLLLFLSHSARSFSKIHPPYCVHPHCCPLLRDVLSAACPPSPALPDPQVTSRPPPPSLHPPLMILRLYPIPRGPGKSCLVWYIQERCWIPPFCLSGAHSTLPVLASTSPRFLCMAAFMFASLHGHTRGPVITSESYKT